MVSLEEFEAELHRLSPLECKLKRLLAGVAPTEDPAPLVDRAFSELVAEGTIAPDAHFDPVDIANSFIRFTDNAEISAFYQSRYFPAGSHVHDFIEGLFVYRGTCRVKSADTVMVLQEGDFCLFSPAYRHDHDIHDDTSIVLLIAMRCDTFNSTFFGLLNHQDILSDYFLRTLYNTQSQQAILFHAAGDSRVAGLVLEMHYERTLDREFRGALLNALLNQLLLVLLRDHRDTVQVVDSSAGPVNGPIVGILRHLQAHVRDGSLGDLAVQFGFTESALSRLLKAATGRNYSQIVRELRSQRAAQMLANPRFTMQAIAEQVGYCDTSHFYRDFRKHFGTTPGDYRRSERP